MGQGASKRRFQQITATYANDRGSILYIKRKKEGQAEAARAPLVWLSNANGEEIPAVYLHSSWDSRRKYTLIYSHAEGEDLGIATSDMSELADFTGCDVFCYEYSGFGLASGEPSESNCYADIQAAYEYLVRDRGVDPMKIVLYGKSLGTGPSVELASKADVAGLVLVSTFLSLSYNKMLRMTGFQRIDAFSNIDKIRKVRCQLLIVHGMRDRVAPYGSVVNLFKRAPNKAPPVIVPFADHDNIATEFRYEVLPFVKRYLDMVSPPLPEHSAPLRALCPEHQQTAASTRRRSITSRLGAGSFLPFSSSPESGNRGDKDEEHGGVFGTRAHVSESDKVTYSDAASMAKMSSRPTVSSLGVVRNSRDSFSTLQGSTAASAPWPPHRTLSTTPLPMATLHERERTRSLDRAREKFWRLLGIESDDEASTIRRRASDSDAPPNMKHSFVNVTTQSQRTKAMVEVLEAEFKGKLSSVFLLQCLRVRRFDVSDAADVARRYRKMMKTLGCHPRRGVSIYDVEMMLRRKVFWASADGVDSTNHPTLFISALGVLPKQQNWLPTLMALIYMLSFLHENEETQIRGISILMDLREVGWGLKHRDFWRRLFRAMLGFYPCRLKRLYILDNGGMLGGPGHFGTGRLAGRYLSRKDVVELKPAALGQYFPRSALPTSLGGFADTSMTAFVENRKRKEAAEERWIVRRRGEDLSLSGGGNPRRIHSTCADLGAGGAFGLSAGSGTGSGSGGRLGASLKASLSERETDGPLAGGAMRRHVPTVGAQRNKSYRLSTDYNEDVLTISFRNSRSYRWLQ